MSDSFAVLSENSDFRNSDPMLVYDFIFIPLVLMEDDTYNLFKSFVLEYLLWFYLLVVVLPVNIYIKLKKWGFIISVKVALRK